MPNPQPPPGKARYFQALWEGFSTCSPQSPDPTQGKGGTDYVIALGLLNLCHSAIKEWGFLNLIEITRSQCEHLAVMISVNYRLPNPCTAPWAISHCFHVLCLQKYARGFSFVSFFFFLRKKLPNQGDVFPPCFSQALRQDGLVLVWSCTICFSWTQNCPN